MDIQGRTVLLLGGSGLVGMAVARRVLEHAPRIIFAIGRCVAACDTDERAGAERIQLEGEFEVLRRIAVITCFLECGTDSDPLASS